MCGSDVRVLGKFAGAEGKSGVGGRGYVRVRREESIERSWWVQSGRREQAWVDAYTDALWHQAVGRLQHGPGRGQQVGDVAGRRIWKKGWGRALGRVGGAGMGKVVSVNRGVDESLRAALLSVVAVPLFVSRAVVLDLRENTHTQRKT